MNKETMVSVPYRGATFLNLDKIYRRIKNKPFPSPIGELHFSIRNNDGLVEAYKLFPSPIGELHFSMLKESPVSIYCTLFPSPIGELHFSII